MKDHELGLLTASMAMLCFTICFCITQMVGCEKEQGLLINEIKKRAYKAEAKLEVLSLEDSEKGQGE